MVTPHIMRLKYLQGHNISKSKEHEKKPGVQILECAFLFQDQRHHLHPQCREMRRLLFLRAREDFSDKRLT